MCSKRTFRRFALSICVELRKTPLAWRGPVECTNLTQSANDFACLEAVQHALRRRHGFDMAAADVFSIGATLYQLLTGQCRPRSHRLGTRRMRAAGTVVSTATTTLLLTRASASARTWSSWKRCCCRGCARRRTGPGCCIIAWMSGVSSQPTSQLLGVAIRGPSVSLASQAFSQ